MPERKPQQETLRKKILRLIPWRQAGGRNERAFADSTQSSTPFNLRDSLERRWGVEDIILAGNGGIRPEDFRKIWPG